MVKKITGPWVGNCIDATTDMEILVKPCDTIDAVGLDPARCLIANATRRMHKLQLGEVHIFRSVAYVKLAKRKHWLRFRVNGNTALLAKNFDAGVIDTAIVYLKTITKRTDKRPAGPKATKRKYRKSVKLNKVRVNALSYL